ncbi:MULTISPECIES: hypothetical protein, partial [Pseudomonas syringae group]|uniref:hypothetical protein n=1 Tax=Pseudomonas syringae group TaxID=136849 RepID=UPI00197D906A
SHSGADTPVLATAFAPPASFNFTMNQFDARQRYVEDVVAPPTRPCSSGCSRHRADTFDVGTAKAQKAKGFPLALWRLPLSVNLTVDQKSPRKVRT